MGITTRSLSHNLGMVTELATYAQNVYIFVSKTHDNQDENVKELANTENYYTSIHNPIREMVFGKKIKPGDVSPVIERYDWVSGTVYQEFYNKSNTIFTVESGSTEQSMFIYTAGGNVYKCIDNNSSANSTVEPTHTDLTPREEADGYKWKYMYSVPSGSKFITSEYIPVVANTIVINSATAGIDRIFLQNGGKNYTSTTNGTVQSTITNSRFIIENNSIANSTGGQVTLSDNYFNNSSILLFEPGAKDSGSLFTVSDYNHSSLEITIDGTHTFSGSTKYEISPRVRITGDGANATAIATVNQSTKTITGIEVKTTGDSYSFANVIIDDSTGTGAKAEAVVPPRKGHGYDPHEELGSDKIMYAVTVEGNESNTITANLQNGFRTVGIISNPSPANVAFTGTVSVSSGQNIVTGSGTKFSTDSVFTNPSLDNVAGLTVNAISTAVLSNTAASNTAKANTLVNLFNEFNKQIVGQAVSTDTILIEGPDFDETAEVLSVTSDTVLHARVPFAGTYSDVGFRKVYKANTFNNIIRLTVDQSNLFSNGEVISSLDKEHFGTLVNQSANTLVLAGTKFPSGITVQGDVSESTANVVVAEVSNSYIDGLYGHTLYINNVLKVSKNDTSNVEFKIVVKV
tara:strand:+ start:9231 stop:11123 length:1893 start_codon:yes stop_codon:yes gene_type:complete